MLLRAMLWLGELCGVTAWVATTAGCWDALAEVPLKGLQPWPGFAPKTRNESGAM